MLCVSQFTLYGRLNKPRPDFSKAMGPQQVQPSAVQSAFTSASWQLSVALLASWMCCHLRACPPPVFAIPPKPFVNSLLLGGPVKKDVSPRLDAWELAILSAMSLLMSKTLACRPVLPLLLITPSASLPLRCQPASSQRPNCRRGTSTLSFWSGCGGNMATPHGCRMACLGQ